MHDPIQALITITALYLATLALVVGLGIWSYRLNKEMSDTLRKLEKEVRDARERERDKPSP